MRYKIQVAFLSALLAGISGYHIYFSWAVHKSEAQAVRYATNEDGTIDFQKKQSYLKEHQDKPVTVFGNHSWFNYTLREAKQRALGFDCSLAGGGLYVLAIDQAEVVKKWARGHRDSGFLRVLDAAKRQYAQDAGIPFLDRFYAAWKAVYPDKTLASVFGVTGQGKLTPTSSDQAVLQDLTDYIKARTNETKELLKRRLDPDGVAEVQVEDGNRLGQIIVTAPGATDDGIILAQLTETGRLSFHEVVESPAELQSFCARASKAPRLKAFHDLLSKCQIGNGYLVFPAQQVKQAQQFCKNLNVQMLLSKGQLLVPAAKTYQHEGQEIFFVYLIQAGDDERGLLSGEVIVDANAKLDSMRGWGIHIRMNPEGAKKWASITKKLRGKQIAIMLGNRIHCAPSSQGEIPNGESLISGRFTQEEAVALSKILVSGALPFSVEVIESAIIGPSMGIEAQQDGIFSALLGLLLIILFMLAYYGTGGVIAVIALLCNAMFIFGGLAQFGANLTMAGIASFLLTMGMAVDANVLIFAWISEELRKGRFLREAISIGHAKAYSSILDSNITTLFAGVVLYLFGQGALKGFATILIIGIISSLFTSVLLANLLISLYLQFIGTRGLTFTGIIPGHLLRRKTINFISLRKFSYGVSIALILVGAALMYRQGGLNLGVEFTGGRSYIVQFSEVVPITKVRAAANKAFDECSVMVQTYGSNKKVRVTTGYRVDDTNRSVNKQIEQRLINELAAATGKKYVNNETMVHKESFSIEASTKTGSQAADDLRQSVQKALILALLAIFLYILMRFRSWQFSLSAIIALFHDALMVFVAFAIARFFGKGFEINQAFVAAILTVVGYSINNTVIVFDRMRARFKGWLHATNYEEIVNTAINETLGRTIITSLTTLIAVVVCLLFGGEELKGFSFALLAGLLFGTYSSICIVSPLAIDLVRLTQWIRGKFVKPS